MTTFSKSQQNNFVALLLLLTNLWSHTLNNLVYKLNRRQVMHVYLLDICIYVDIIIYMKEKRGFYNHILHVPILHCYLLIELQGSSSASFMWKNSRAAFFLAHKTSKKLVGKTFTVYWWKSVKTARVFFLKTCIYGI